MRSNGLKRWLPVVLLLCIGAPSFGGSGGGSGSSRWGANYFPNIPLVTHEGKSVRFFDDLIEGKVVAINFIYTSCPDSCPLETARLLEVQRILGDRVGRDVFFYSISIDPEVDTPDVLRDYREKFQVGPGWTFLTGKEDDITLLRQKLGLYIDEIQAEDSNDHNLSLIIGNQATGRWMKRSPFENSHFLANQIGSWLHNWKEADPSQDYSNAPELRQLTTGENLYRTRCAACHTIGGGDVTDPALQRVGPDLLGVTRKRDPAWLARWLAEPEKMLAERDPIAIELFARYDEVEMPNMRLNEEVDVPALIGYIREESDRVERERGAQGTALVASNSASRAPGEAKAPKACCKKRRGAAPATAATPADTAKAHEGDREQRDTRAVGPVISGALGLAALLLGAYFRRRA